MRIRKLYYIVFLLFLAQANNSLGQPSRGIILLNNFQQAVDFSYQYNGQTTNTGNTSVSFSDHDFSEAYRFNVDYGLYSPHLLKGHLFTELRYDQDRFSGTNEPSGGTTGLNVRYLVNGTLLDRHPYPVTFFAGTGVANVPRAFASTLEIKTDNYGAGFILKNNFLPIQFNYNLTKSATTGIANERDQSAENFTFLANHRVKDFSETKLELIFSSFQTDSKGGNAIKESFLTNDASISNTLAWKSLGSTANLFTNYRYRQEAGDRQSNTSDFGESLTWQFGRALETGANYSNTMQQNLGQNQTENRGDVWLKHQLFQSLRTYVQLLGRAEQYSTGRENELSGTISLDYQKKLPANSQLQMGFSRSYGVIDRNLSGTRISINDESIIASFLGPITLKNLDIVPDSIVVRNAARTITYSPNTDYTVTQLSRITLITINPGGLIPSDVTLLVNYDINVNPSIKYAKNTQNLTGALLLFAGRYRIFANLENYDQEYLSGRLDSSNILQSRTFRTGMEFNGEKVSAHGEYVNYDSTYSVYQSVDASMSYTKDFVAGTLLLSLSDRLTFRENLPPVANVIVVPGTVNSTSSGGSSGYDNSFNTGATYRRNLLNLALMNLSASYLNVSGLLRQDAFTVRLGIQSRLGKTIAQLQSEVHWLIAGNSSRRDDRVNLELTRYF